MRHPASTSRRDTVAGDPHGSWSFSPEIFAAAGRLLEDRGCLFSRIAGKKTTALVSMRSPGSSAASLRSASKSQENKREDVQ